VLRIKFGLRRLHAKKNVHKLGVAHGHGLVLPHERAQLHARGVPAGSCGRSELGDELLVARDERGRVLRPEVGNEPVNVVRALHAELVRAVADLGAGAVREEHAERLVAAAARGAAELVEQKPCGAKLMQRVLVVGAPAQQRAVREERVHGRLCERGSREPPSPVQRGAVREKLRRPVYSSPGARRRAVSERVGALGLRRLERLRRQFLRICPSAFGLVEQ
jgi:hypothetical protein